MKFKIISILIYFLFFSVIVSAAPLKERTGEIRTGIGSGNLEGVIAVGKYTNNSINIPTNVSIDARLNVNTSLDISTNQSVLGSINMSLYSDNPTGVTFGAIAINKYLDIEVSQNIIDSLQWSIIKIYYTDAEITGVIESLLRIYWFNGTDWVPFNPPEGGVNTAENYVWANVTHFSVYGVFLSPPYCGDNVCYGGEGCSSCPQDCGTCPPSPGPGPGAGGGGGGGGGGGAPTGPTTPTTTTTTVAPTAVCGNGICESGESNSNCPADCPAAPTTTTTPTPTTPGAPAAPSPITGFVVFVSSPLGISLLLSVIIAAVLIIVFYKKWYIPRKIKKE